MKWTYFDLASTSTSFFILVCPGVHWWVITPYGMEGGIFYCRGQKEGGPRKLTFLLFSSSTWDKNIFQALHQFSAYGWSHLCSNHAVLEFYHRPSETPSFGGQSLISMCLKRIPQNSCHQAQNSCWVSGWQNLSPGIRLWNHLLALVSPLLHNFFYCHKSNFVGGL